MVELFPTMPIGVILLYMRRYTTKEIWIEYGISERTLIKRAVARRIGKKRGREWLFAVEELPLLMKRGIRGNPALKKG